MDIKSAVDSGNYKANNYGNLNIQYTKIANNLSFFNKNDNINIILPKNLEFEFVEKTKNSLILINFQKYIIIEKKTAKCRIRSHPNI